MINKKYLFIRTDRIGDFLLSAILIKSIKRSDKNAKITVIAEINITLLRHRHPVFNLFKKGLKREEVPGKELRLLTNCGFV